MDSVDIPRVTSDLDARQDGHVLEELGEMGVPQMQQRTERVVGVVVVVGMQVPKVVGSSIL